MRALQDQSKQVKYQNKLSFPPDSAQLSSREPEQQPSRTLRDEKYISHICHRHHRRCLCKNFLSGVNFSRLKMHIFDFFRHILVFLVPLVVFLGVKFGFRKSCQCKRNDKYDVWKSVKTKSLYRRGWGGFVSHIIIHLHWLDLCKNLIIWWI